MLDESSLDLLKADILAQMRDTAVKRFNNKGYKVNEGNIDSSGAFMSKQSLIIDTDLLAEIKSGDVRREYSMIAKDIKGELNA